MFAGRGLTLLAPPDPARDGLGRLVLRLGGESCRGVPKSWVRIPLWLNLFLSRCIVSYPGTRYDLGCRQYTIIRTFLIYSIKSAVVADVLRIGARKQRQPQVDP